MSILGKALSLSVSNENKEYHSDPQAGIVLAQAEQATTEAIAEHAAYDAGIVALESLVTTAEKIDASGVSQESNDLYATSTAVIADKLGIEQDVLGTEINTTSIEGVKEVIAQIKRVIISAFKSAGDFFKKFLLSVANFFAANEKSRDALVEELNKLEKDVMFKDGAFDSVAKKAGVVMYATDYSAVKNIKADSSRVDAVIKGLDGVADKIVEGAEAVYAGIADAMVTYKSTDIADDKEVKMFNEEGTLTLIGQKGGKLVGTVTGGGKGKVVEVTIDAEKAGKAIAGLTKDAKFIKTLADDIMDFGDKGKIKKATDGILSAVTSLQKSAEKDLDGESEEQLKALSPLYRFVIGVGFAEAKTILDRYTASYAFGKAVIAGKEEKEDIKDGDEKPKEK